MIRNHSKAAVSGLIVSGVNLTFHVLFTAMDFVFCKSGVLLILHHQDTLLSKFGLQNTVSLSPKVLKSVQHWLCGIVAAMSKL